MIELYHELLLVLDACPEGTTLGRMKRMGRGKFACIVDDCIQKDLIIALCKNTLDEDLYFISEEGKKLLDNPKEYKL